MARNLALLLASGLISTSAASAASAAGADDEIVMMGEFRVVDNNGVTWRYATCEGFEILSDLEDGRMRLFAREFATFLRFARQVCPELLLPEGTKLSIILASPAQFGELSPKYPSPLGYEELPWGVLARTQDTAVMAMRFEGIPEGGRFSTRDADARDTLIRAQATYLNDPALVAHRKVIYAGRPPGIPFIVAVGESRPFLASQQPFLKTGVLAIISGLGSAVGNEYSYHDQSARWVQYFPNDRGGTQDLAGTLLPIKTLPPLENLFAIDVDSPAWSSPHHRLLRDGFVHWAMLARGPEGARAFLDFLARCGPEPVTAAQFAETFGGGFAETTPLVMKYIDPKVSDRSTKLPSRNFWNRLPHVFRDAGSSYESRLATLEESSRIRADFLRLVGRPDAAERALSPRFKKNQLNDHIWITAGLMMMEKRNAAEAVKSFQAALALGTKRPLPYVELARIQLRLAQARRAGKKELNREEATAIFALLCDAHARPPALRETPFLVGDMIEWCKESPLPEWSDLLEAAAKAWPYEAALHTRSAAIFAQKGDAVRARRMMEIARAGTIDRNALAQLDKVALTLERSTAGEVAAPRREESSPAVTATGELVPERDEQGFTVPGLELAMVRIAPGKFTMGSAPQAFNFKRDQQPVTQVTLTRGFWMGKHEVTQRQWRELMGTTLAQQAALESASLPTNGVGDMLPMYQVAWDEATEFCRALTRQERAAGRITERFEYRLPTEAQWEYACRAGTVGPFFDAPADVAWLPPALPPRWMIPFNNVTYVPTVHPVGTKKPNAWGLHDMYGNVSEWCLDWYGPALPGGRTIDPTGPVEGVYRVVRGGSAWGVEVGVPIIGSAVRSKDVPTGRFARGFRPVLVEKVD